MRISISGTAHSGKTTLLNSFLYTWKNYESPDKTYRDLLKEESLDHSSKTTTKTQERILDFMIDQLQSEIIKCQMGTVTLNWLDNSGASNSWVCNPSTSSDDLVETIVTNAIQHFKGSDYKMCFKTTDDMVVRGSSCPSDVDVGRMHINANKGDDRVDLYTRWEPAGNGCIKSSISLE